MANALTYESWSFRVKCSSDKEILIRSSIHSSLVIPVDQHAYMRSTKSTCYKGIATNIAGIPLIVCVCGMCYWSLGNFTKTQWCGFYVKYFGKI